MFSQIDGFALAFMNDDDLREVGIDAVRQYHVCKGCSIIRATVPVFSFVPWVCFLQVGDRAVIMNQVEAITKEKPSSCPVS